MVLFINACVRDMSRTKRLADRMLKRLNGPVCEIRLDKVSFPTADQAFLDLRDELVQKGNLDHPLLAFARQFAEADTVVVAAPYWDLSFPAALKQYFEQINAVGVTFSYSPEGIPVGMCRAKSLYYVTTAGGPIINGEYGFGYVKALAGGYYGIDDVRLIKAEGLDIQGADTEAILRRAERDIDEMPLSLA